MQKVLETPHEFLGNKKPDRGNEADKKGGNENTGTAKDDFLWGRHKQKNQHVR